MYKLVVSYDCGAHYLERACAETLEELELRTADLDAQGLRWGIDDEDGEPVGPVCSIHKGIMELFSLLAKLESVP